jgi:hypothetical protein
MPPARAYFGGIPPSKDHMKKRTAHPDARFVFSETSVRRTTNESRELAWAGHLARTLAYRRSLERFAPDFTSYAQAAFGPYGAPVPQIWLRADDGPPPA